MQAQYRGPALSGHPKRFGGFKICGAARHSYILQAPVIKALQFMARADAVPPFGNLLFDLAPAQVALGMRCQMQTDRVHRTLHIGEL